MHARSQAVAVAQAEFFRAYLHHLRLLQPLQAQLLEVAVRPDVVVAREEIDLHAGIQKRHQCSKHPHIAFGHHVAVLVPEVPDVAHEVQRLRLRRINTLQESHEGVFPRGRIPHPEAQMDVGDEICQVLGHYPKMKISPATTRQ